MDSEKNMDLTEKTNFIISYTILDSPTKTITLVISPSDDIYMIM